MSEVEEVGNHVNIDGFNILHNEIYNKSYFMIFN